MAKRLAAGLLILAVSVVESVTAENSQDFGDYIVHFNALTTDFLQPKVAQLYEIRRSPNRALLTVSVHRKSTAPAGTPVAASISGQAVNLSAQIKELDFREIREEHALYYISDFPVAHQETLDFTLNIAPADAQRRYTVKFRKQFFTR